MLIPLPSVKDVARALKAVRDNLKNYEDVPDADVRLQVMESGSWTVHSGDPSYDQDHRGYWGASIVARTDSLSDLDWLARELLGEVTDMIAWHNPRR